MNFSLSATACLDMRSLIIQKKRSQFDLLTFAGHTFGSTEELPPPPLCLDQVGPWVGKDQFNVS